MSDATHAVDVRLADPADGPLVATLRRAWGLEGGDPVHDSFDAAFDEWWRSEHDRRRTWLACFGGEPVGMLSMVVVHRMPKPGRLDSRWGYVAHAFVLAGFRGRGIGTRLLEACTSYADEEGFARLVLNPNEGSVSLYERDGFAPATELLLRRPPARAAE